ncbi:hypothetical protein [Mycobacterium canetti]|uniref:hypothetical protein n=1 Tax=Mycobacterium canetti TaxID=78331 RepID=UPI000345DE06|nr:hypothetical protein [Mycobacterium canetti]
MSGELPEVPDVEVARYALRTFRIDYERGVLKSVAVEGDHWTRGVCEAVCAHPCWPVYPVDHKAPEVACRCGIYGCLTLDDLVRQWSEFCRDIVAVIAVEGTTIIGYTGLRTEAARIVAYWTPLDTIRQICTQTCTGAIYFRSINKMLTAYGFTSGSPRQIKRPPVRAAIVNFIDQIFGPLKFRQMIENILLRTEFRP